MTVLLAGGDLVLGAVGTVTYVDGADRARLRPPVPQRRPRAASCSATATSTRPSPPRSPAPATSSPSPGRSRAWSSATARTASPRGAARSRASPRSRTATDTGRGTESTVRATIAPDERTVPIVAGLLQDEPAVRVRDGVARRHADAADRDHEPRPARSRSSTATSTPPPATWSRWRAARLPRMLTVLMQNGVRPVPVSAISVTQRLESRVRAARILGASIRRARPARGRHPRAAPAALAGRRRASVRVPVRLPAGVDASAPGRARDPEVGGRLRPASRRPHPGPRRLGRRWRARPAVVGRAERLAARATGQPPHARGGRPRAASPTTATTRSGCWRPATTPTTRRPASRCRCPTSSTAAARPPGCRFR